MIVETSVKTISEAAIRLFIATLNGKIESLVNKDWANADAPEYEAFILQVSYDRAVKESFTEVVNLLKDNLK